MKKIILLILIILLPVDWFSITGGYLREAGAKPIIPLLLMLFLFYLILNKIRLNKITINVIILHLLIIVFGLISFLININVNTDGIILGRNSNLQFFYQMIMQFIFIIIFITFSIILTTKNIDLFKLIRAAAIFHLIIYIFEFLNIPFIDEMLIEYFRSGNKLIDRPSGLMSEPSYYGVMCAIYSVSLMINKKRSVFDFLIILLLLITLSFSMAKTAFLIFLFQVPMFLIKSKNKFKIIIISFLFILPSFYYLASVQNVFTIQENLSSMMRFGSTITALNVFLDSHIIFGIGTGQFHFYFIEKYVLDIFLYSKEIINQMSGQSSSRASTFNYPIRVLLETGLFGFAILLFINIIMFRKIIKITSQKMLLGGVIVCGSLAFLFTQDTYCYPFLAFGYALVCREENMY